MVKTGVLTIYRNVRCTDYERRRSERVGGHDSRARPPDAGVNDLTERLIDEVQERCWRGSRLLLDAVLHEAIASVVSLST